MHFVLFYHSLVSDWNHGNAHFLRGVATELLARGHSVAIHEPLDGWSYANLTSQHGCQPVDDFRARFPHLRSARYDEASLSLDAVLDGADVVIVHEWNSRALIREIGAHRKRRGKYRLYFHDTHHRSVSSPESMGTEHLRDYDGALVFGESLRELYRNRGWTSRAWVWHEAADIRVFHPRDAHNQGELVWIGNWGDGERAAELEEFLIEPSRRLGLRAWVHGVRYPQTALDSLNAAGIFYGGWVPNFRVPEIFARFSMTLHIPRRPYREQLAGVPTIRVFEALACGIPLICAPWEDRENLFSPGKDYLVAQNASQMTDYIRELRDHEPLRRELASHGRRTIEKRHTCRHRVDELLEIVRQ
jgi:spore maturation protein CgeB